MGNKEIRKCEKIEANFQKIIKGCRKRTGYFEGSPYYCGDIIQTTPCDGFQSYCRKCMPIVKKIMGKFDSVIVPVRERLRQLKKKFAIQGLGEKDERKN